MSAVRAAQPYLIVSVGPLALVIDKYRYRFWCWIIAWDRYRLGAGHGHVRARTNIHRMLSDVVGVAERRCKKLLHNEQRDQNGMRSMTNSCCPHQSMELFSQMQNHVVGVCHYSKMRRHANQHQNRTRRNCQTATANKQLRCPV